MMSSKQETKDRVTLQQRKRFLVGPAHLPDGSRKRKADKIKRDIIHKAKVKREYAKVRERELAQQPNLHHYDGEESKNSDDGIKEPPSSLQRHPDRENMINDPSLPAITAHSGHRHPDDLPSSTDHKHRHKPLPFRNEVVQAENLRAEAESRRRVRQEAEMQKMHKLQDRERTRKAMAKARGSRSGQRKLGGESRVLLEKVKKLVAEP